jgi:hypothetical protein
LFPHMANIIDEFCIVRSMISDHPQSRTVRVDDEHGQRPRWAARRWAPGWFTGWGQRTRIFRVHCAVRRAGGGGGGLARPFFRRSTREQWCPTI